jgi:hypothetical protein
MNKKQGCLQLLTLGICVFSGIFLSGIFYVAKVAVIHKKLLKKDDYP